MFIDEVFVDKVKKYLQCYPNHKIQIRSKFCPDFVIEKELKRDVPCMVLTQDNPAIPGNIIKLAFEYPQKIIFDLEKSFGINMLNKFVRVNILDEHYKSIEKHCLNDFIYCNLTTDVSNMTLDINYTLFEKEVLDILEHKHNIKLDELDIDEARRYIGLSVSALKIYLHCAITNAIDNIIMSEKNKK